MVCTDLESCRRQLTALCHVSVPYPVRPSRLSQARTLDFSDSPAKQEAFALIDFDAFEREVQETEAACLRLNSPVVFTHHDLLCGNVLVPHEVSSWKPAGRLGYETLANIWTCQGSRRSPHWASSAIIHCHDCTHQERAGHMADCFAYCTARHDRVWLRSLPHAYCTSQNVGTFQDLRGCSSPLAL